MYVYYYSATYQQTRRNSTVKYFLQIWELIYKTETNTLHARLNIWIKFNKNALLIKWKDIKLIINICIYVQIWNLKLFVF